MRETIGNYKGPKVGAVFLYYDEEGKTPHGKYFAFVEVLQKYVDKKENAEELKKEIKKQLYGHFNQGKKNFLNLASDLEYIAETFELNDLDKSSENITKYFENQTLQNKMGGGN